MRSEGFESDLCQRGLGDDHEIAGVEVFLLQAKILPNLAFYAVSDNRPFTDFFGDDKAEPCVAQPVFGSVHADMGVVRALLLLKHAPEIGGFEQSLRFSKSSRTSRHAVSAFVRVSGAQSRATLRAAGADDRSTTAGFHACAKTVGALAFQYAGLKCTFHDRESA